VHQGSLEHKGNGSLALPSEWTSLPGGKENAHRLTADKKPMDMAYFQTLFDQYLNEEKGKGMSYLKTVCGLLALLMAGMAWSADTLTPEQRRLSSLLRRCIRMIRYVRVWGVF
jgi:hypothetical protein